MNKVPMTVIGCGLLLAATLLPVSATAESKKPAEKSVAVNHRNEQYDANKDGKLDETEVAAMKADRAAKKKARLLAKYDANKNGVIDPEEEAVHQSDLEKRRLARAEKKKAKDAEKAAEKPDEDEEDEEEAPKKP